jgi:hypothetical protein
MRKRGDLSYIVGSMRFSGYLRQARYGMTATHSGSKLYGVVGSLFAWANYVYSSNLFKEQALCTVGI